MNLVEGLLSSPDKQSPPTTLIFNIFFTIKNRQQFWNCVIASVGWALSNCRWGVEPQGKNKKWYWVEWVWFIYRKPGVCWCYHVDLFWFKKTPKTLMLFLLFVIGRKCEVRHNWKSLRTALTPVNLLFCSSPSLVLLTCTVTFSSSGLTIRCRQKLNKEMKVIRRRSQRKVACINWTLHTWILPD